LHSNVVEPRALAVTRNGEEEKKWEDKKTINENTIDTNHKENSNTTK
jgi:hypothetical protein